MMNMHNLPCYTHQGGAVDVESNIDRDPTMMTNDDVVAFHAMGRVVQASSAIRAALSAEKVPSSDSKLVCPTG